MAARHYELMVILAPDLEERTVAPSLDQFLSVVRTVAATWKRSMSGAAAGSPTRSTKNFEGIYAVVDLSAEPAAVKELDRQLNLNESVLRTKLLRLGKHSTRRGSYV